MPDPTPTPYDWRGLLQQILVAVVTAILTVLAHQVVPPPSHPAPVAASAK